MNLFYKLTRKSGPIEGNLYLKKGRIMGRKDPRFTYIGKDSSHDLNIESFIEKPVRSAACKLHSKNIYTYYSESGGPMHGTCTDYSYVLSRLFRKNAEIARKNNFILDSITYNLPSNIQFETKKTNNLSYEIPICKPRVINFTYPENARIGYYILGINRKGLNDKEVIQKLDSLVGLLETQENDLAGRKEGIRKEERAEIDQLNSVLNKI